MFFSICQVQSGNARDKRLICCDENIHKFSTREKDTSSSSVIFADILVPTQAIKVHIATILEVKTPILLRLILYAQIGLAIAVGDTCKGCIPA